VVAVVAVAAAFAAAAVAVAVAVALAVAVAAVMFVVMSLAAELLLAASVPNVRLAHWTLAIFVVLVLGLPHHLRFDTPLPQQLLSVPFGTAGNTQNLMLRRRCSNPRDTECFLG